MTDLDPTDKAIIEALQVDGRLQYSDLGPMVGLSQAAVRQRVRRLLDAGVMQVVAVTDPASLGFGLQALIGITVEGDIRAAADALAEVDEIDYVVVTAGRFDLFAEVVCADHRALLDLVNDRIRPVPGVTGDRGVHLPRPRQADLLVGHPLAATGSVWADGLDEADALAGEHRPPLDGSVDADVAIVGGGFTGLWTALHLARLDPSTRVVVVEAEVCGWGASGRNGGWASAFFAGSRRATARRHGRDAAVALQRAMHTAVDELGRTAASEGIDCDFHKGGTLNLATNAPQEARLRAGVDEERRWGFGPDDVSWLDAEAATARVAAAGVRGGVFTPHCARIHPARLVRGLAAAAERRGVVLAERTRAERIEPGRVVTATGRRASALSSCAPPRATRRPCRAPGGVLAPLHSLMIATEPLPDDVWADLGWADAETLTDGRYLIIYAQRTADGRIAFGGRGAPYRFGSRAGGSAESSPAVWTALAATLRDLLPAVGFPRITHRWGGALGVPRDWYSSVGLDRATGLAWGGGYVGDGVTTSFLAGRTLADLILGRDSELHGAAVGGPSEPAVGARAAALARDQRRAAPHRLDRPLRGAERALVTMARSRPRSDGG